MFCSKLSTADPESLVEYDGREARHWTDLLDHSEDLLRRDLVDKVVVLVRDPRATVHSRTGVSWCSEVAAGDCSNVTLLCTDLAQSHYSYQQLSSTFGEDKITYVRSDIFLIFT